MNNSVFKLFIVLVLTAFSEIGKAQRWIPFDEHKEGDNISTEIIRSNPTEYLVKVTIHGLSEEVVVNEMGEFHCISIGRNEFLSKVGEPSLPLFSQTTAIPTGAKLTAKVIDEQWTDVEIGKIYPTQESFLGNRQPMAFCYDEVVYCENYIPTLLTISESSQWRNIQNANISVCPFKYYPQENRLSVMNQFVLQVSFEYDQRRGINSYPNIEDPYCLFDNIPYTDISQIQIQDNPMATRSSYDYYNYLIIIGDGLVLSDSTKLKEFRRWKALKGFKTKVASIDTIGTQSSQIKNYILQEYNKGVRYVLFIGDSYMVPLAEVYTPINRTVLSDYWYGCLDGDNDVQAEIPIGRFSVETSSDLGNIIDKTIKYEGKYQSSNEVLLVAHNEGAPGNFQYCCNEIYNSHNNQMNFSTAYGACGATNADVVDSINNGAHIVNYRGHGAPTFWGSLNGWNSSSETFTASEIANMDDETCSVFFSVACQTGLIKNNTCMLETFTRSDHGAVAFIGATEETDPTPNNSYDKSLFNKLLDNDIYHLGDLNVSAHLANITISNKYKDNAFCYLCGGDPALELWTATPQVMSVDWTVGTESVFINTNLTGGFCITVASEDGELLDSIACSSSSGIVSLPSNYDRFYIAVMKHNYIPHVIRFDTISEEIYDKTFDHDAYYSATPLDIFSMNDEVIVKCGHKLSIKNGSDGVKIWENFKCEKGAIFEIK